MDQLTKRQEEIYQVYIEQPCQNLSSIAKNFGIALSTVKIHLGAAHKLGKPYRTKYKINDTIRLDFILFNGKVFLNNQQLKERDLIDAAIVRSFRDASKTSAKPSNKRIYAKKLLESKFLD